MVWKVGRYERLGDEWVMRSKDPTCPYVVIVTPPFVVKLMHRVRMWWERFK